MDSTIPQPNLVVVGADSTVGSEVARLGVAYGATVYGTAVDARPPSDEPWTHGVAWSDESSDAMILAAAFDSTVPTTLVIIGASRLEYGLELAGQIAPRRLVVAMEESTARAVVAPGSSQLVVATHRQVLTGALSPEQDTADENTIHCERLAMAVLRLALDELPEGDLDHDALARLGDAVFWA